MINRIGATLVTLVLSISLQQSGLAQRPSPVMEFSSVLSSLDVFPDGRLALEDDNSALATVFLPAGSPVDVVIAKSGSNAPIHTQPMAASAAGPVFHRLSAGGRLKTFHFTEPGEYVAVYRAAGKPMTVVPFSVEAESNEDQFDPKTNFYLNGPWNDWACLFASVNAGEDAQPQFRMWVRKKSFLASPDADKYDVVLKKDGDVIAVSSSGFTSAKKWQMLRFDLRHPDSKGGQAMKLGELVARDGTYQVLVTRNDETYAAYELQTQDGKLVPHPRQAAAHQPRTEYLVPRFPGILGTQGANSMGHLFWMERLDDDAARVAIDASPAKVAGPSDDDLKRWEWLPRSIDPNRQFRLTITDVETRSDTNIAVGEDLVVFGTGFPTGVRYLRAGENTSREIPGGETYSSKLFHVCGTKIVLVRKTQVVIFDTATEKLTEIPSEEINLYDPRGGLHRSNLLNADGFLVAAINRATAVTDRTILKVIDISGDNPVIIPIKNSDYVDYDVSSVSLDARNGAVAVSCGQKKLVAVAPIARLANQRVFDLTEYRGLGRQQIELDDGYVAYLDGDGNVRVLDLDAGHPKAITDHPAASSGNGFSFRKGRIATPITDGKVGTRCKMAIGDFGESVGLPKGTGTPIEGTSGALGMAGSAAIAIDKSVFIAGTPSGGIGVGEHLQLLTTEGQWIPIRSNSGKVVSAIDVTTSMGFAGFKASDDAGKTVVGYMTYGEQIDGEQVRYKEQSSGIAEAPAPQPMTKTVPQKTGLSENDSAFIDAILESEDEVLAALIPAIGEKAAKKQMLDASLNTLKTSEREHLIEIYKTRTKTLK